MAQPVRSYSRPRWSLQVEPDPVADFVHHLLGPIPFLLPGDLTLFLTALLVPLVEDNSSNHNAQRAVVPAGELQRRVIGLSEEWEWFHAFALGLLWLFSHPEERREFRRFGHHYYPD